jgi:hypothetical protein
MIKKLRIKGLDENHLANKDLNKYIARKVLFERKLLVISALKDLKEAEKKLKELLKML